MRSKVRFSTAIIVTVFLSTVLSSAVAQSSVIKDFQVFANNSGVVFTADSLFKTNDSGKTWTQLSVPHSMNEHISNILFEDGINGVVVLADPATMRIAVARTKDGGASWSRNDIVLTNATEFELNFETAQITGNVSGLLEISLRIQTSSNFIGQERYRSSDGGSTWQFYDRSVEPNTETEASSAVRKSNWSVETKGECFGFKTGCVQETQLLISGSVVTPPQIADLALRERTAAQSEAAKTPMFAVPGGSTRISLSRGFDKCQAGSISQMQTWWNNSPHQDANIYMSGRARACGAATQPFTNNPAWIDAVSAQGWGLIPTIVGYQAPCSVSSTPHKFSSDAPTAETQGRGEADIAVTDAISIGLTAGSILYYDMERYNDTGDGVCSAAAIAFLKGWTERIHELGYQSGVYGSPNNAVPDWWPMPAASRMDAIWMARWDNVMSVWTYNSPSPAFPVGAWENHQRIKQWQAPHNETWGGVTFNIDGNIADGPVAGVSVPKNRNADFDGDGKADISIFRPEDGNWWILKSSNSTLSVTGFGVASDVLVPSDYDGDGKTDIAVFRDGTWYSYGKGNTVSIFQWGSAGDIPVPGDYNGDGKAERAVYRPASGVWYTFGTDSRSTVSIFEWGIAGDIPVPGDYDGDGKMDIAVYRPSTGVWYIQRSSDQTVTVVQWGVETDKLAPADYDGDGKTDIAIFREGQWWVNRSTAGFAVYDFGLPGDIPVSGHFDANAATDIAVYRPSTGVWYLLRDQDGFVGIQFGSATDKPVPNAYFPQ